MLPSQGTKLTNVKFKSHCNLVYDLLVQSTKQCRNSCDLQVHGPCRCRCALLERGCSGSVRAGPPSGKRKGKQSWQTHLSFPSLFTKGLGKQNALFREAKKKIPEILTPSGRAGGQRTGARRVTLYPYPWGRLDVGAKYIVAAQ
jgi:hypothetical protein